LTGPAAGLACGRLGLRPAWLAGRPGRG